MINKKTSETSATQDIDFSALDFFGNANKSSSTRDAKRAKKTRKRKKEQIEDTTKEIEETENVDEDNPKAKKKKKKKHTTAIQGLLSFSVPFSNPKSTYLMAFNRWTSFYYLSRRWPLQ